jgi:hypothetical protein
MSAFINWYLRSGPPYFLEEAAVCVICTGVRKIWQYDTFTVCAW